MSELSLLISRLRKVSFFLFLIPTVALLGSLLLHNSIASFNFIGGYENSNKIFPFTLDCNEENAYCLEPIYLRNINYKKKIPIYRNTNTEQYIPINFSNYKGAQLYEKLDTCQKYKLKLILKIDNKKIDDVNYFKNNNKLFIKKFLTKSNNYKDYNYLELKNEYLGKKIQVEIIEINRKSRNCIKNSSFYFLYKVLPQPFNWFKKLKSSALKKGNVSIINPLIYGETSISNVVKRFPVNWLFKPFLYLSSILMIFYWMTYQKVFNNINNIKKIDKFLIFGVASSIFLFLHVLFLGMEIDSQAFKKLRRLIIISFLLCELIAQYFLVRKIYEMRALVFKYLYKNLVFTKFAFVSIILFASTIIVAILIFYNLSSAFDNILEWNYFLLLLIFYLLSSIMWKKKNN